MRSSILALTLLGSACSGGVAFLSSDGYSALVLVEAASSPTATAFDMTAADAVVERNAPTDAPLFAFEYMHTLATLGLPVGPLSLGSTGAPMPIAERWDRLDGSTWTQVTSLPASISDLHVTRANLCAAFEATSRSFPRAEGEIASYALPIDADRVFVGTSSGAFYIVTAAETQRIDLPQTIPHFAGTKRGSEMWLVGSDRHTAHGDPDHGFVPGPDLPFDLNRDARIDASPADQPLELFVTDPTLAVAHFDGQTWATIRTASGIPNPRVRQGIAWAEPHLAALIGASDSRIIELAADGFERSTLLDIPVRPTGDNLWSVYRVEGVGVVAGTRYDVLFKRGISGWEKLGDPTLTPVADAIFGIGSGDLIAGGQGGVYVEWRADGEVCEPLTDLGRLATRVIAPLGNGFAAISDSSGGTYTLIIARRTR